MISTWHSEEFWINLERLVSATVEQALRESGARRAAVIEYLENIEEMARREPDRRQTLQILASGRNLLGERSGIRPPRDSFGGPLRPGQRAGSRHDGMSTGRGGTGIPASPDRELGRRSSPGPACDDRAVPAKPALNIREFGLFDLMPAQGQCLLPSRVNHE